MSPDATTPHPADRPAAPAAWAGLLDDVAAAGVPTPGLDVADVARAHAAGRARTGGDLLGRLTLPDDLLPQVRDLSHPVHLELTGGAGQVAGPAGWASRHDVPLAGLSIVLRDIDNLAANVRRVVAAVDSARGDGVLDDDVPVHVEIPVDSPGAGWGHPSGAWLQAADEVAAAELRLDLRIGGGWTDRFPSPTTLVAWIDAALDREVAFRCVGGGVHATSTGLPVEDGVATAFGFANVLLATRQAFDGADRSTVAASLVEADPARLGEALQAEEYLAATRRWLTGWAAAPHTSASTVTGTAVDGLRQLGQWPDAQ